MRNFKHYLAAFIPVKKWRKKVRGKKKSETSLLTEQILVLDNKISQLYKLVVLKEVAPDLLKHFKIDLFQIDGGVYDSYKTNLIYNPEIAAIRNQFSIEQEFLTSCLSHVENDVSYEKRCQIFEDLIQLNTLHKPMIYLQYISNVFRQRDIKKLEHIFKQMNQEPDSWEIMLRRSRLAEISFYLLNNEKERAEELLSRYIKRWGLIQVANLLPVAQLATEMGIKDGTVKKGALLFKAFDNAEKDKTFEKMIKGKKVAIVGNGPQELDSGNGKKIDSYDVVIRFNGGAKTGEKYAKDYGTKTTILARWLGAPFPNSKFDLLAQAEDIYFLCIDDSYLLELYNYIKGGNKITYFYDKNNCQNELKINTPTTGIQYLWWVKHINPNFSMDDCYGFSFKDQEVERNPRDFYDLMKNLSREPHNLLKEKNTILSLFAKG